MGKEDTAPLISSPSPVPVVNVPYQPTAPQYVVYQPNPNVVYQQQPIPNVVYQQPNSNVVYQQPNNNVVYQQPLVYGAPPQGYPGAQVVYVQQVEQRGSYNGQATAALILYILSTFGFWVCSLPSIIISLNMVSKRVIPYRNRAAVIACSIFELIGFVFLPLFVWYGNEDCETFWTGYSYYTNCYFIWWGWIALIVWWVFTIAFGIPRIVYTFNARNNNPEHC